MPYGDGRWWGKDENSPATQETRGAKTEPGISMEAVRNHLAAQLRPQQDKIVRASGDKYDEKEQEASMQAVYFIVAVGTRPKHGTLAST